jgi:site-specific DNA recombinase
MIAKTKQQPTIRCAIYTRKSSEEGLEQEFNSLDAQRESAEAYITSQQHEGWTCLPEHYDDGGFTGGNMERPALQRLMADIEAGKVDCVMVYKVDRLSRSLLDFARMMRVFEQHDVSFVSVTQQFNTATSMGRLMLNVLLSFAQFEREMISERTRDKIAAARRRGKWSGGMPLLGYDVVDTKLVVNDPEAVRVREIFKLYLGSRSLLAAVKKLDLRGWVTKHWVTKKGTQRGGKAFNKTRLHQLLTNVTYIGQIKYKDEVHEGEHEAIVDSEVFRKTQLALNRNSRNRDKSVRNKHGALLKGLLRCAHCSCAMAHSYTKKGQNRYRYYVCTQAQKRGWSECPSPSVPAGEIERFVVEQIKCIGRDPKLVAATLAQVRQQSKQAIRRLTKEKNALQRQRRADEAELLRLMAKPATNGEGARLAEVQQRLEASGRRLAAIEGELVQLADQDIDQAAVTAALADFDVVWESLSPRQQASVLELLIESVDCNGQDGNLSITFRPTGIRALAVTDPEEYAA